MNIVIKTITEIIKKHCPELKFEVLEVSKQNYIIDNYFYRIAINIDLHKCKNSTEYIDFSFVQEQESVDLSYKNPTGAYISSELEWELSQNLKIDYKSMLIELKNYIKQLNNGKY